MPHIIILMNEKLDEMDGGSSTGSVNALREAVNTADLFLSTAFEAQAVEAAHEKLEEVQAWLVDDSTAGCGAADVINGFITDLEPYR